MKLCFVQTIHVSLMCNFCECDNIEQCSIVGKIPIGFCCENCDKIGYCPNEPKALKKLFLKFIK